jgi:uncharacterized repeat protein (TIGR01451 family)
LLNEQCRNESRPTWGGIEHDKTPGIFGYKNLKKEIVSVKGQSKESNRNSSQQVLKTKSNTIEFRRKQMKTASRNIFWAMLLIGAIAMLAPQAALAGGTAPGISVTNSATVTYSVNAVVQPTITRTAGFVVDDKVMFTLTTGNSSNVSVLPSGRAYMTYTLTNTGNGAHDFTLVTTATGTNNLVPAAPDNPRFYSDLGVTPVPTDALVVGTPQYISNLASDGTATVNLYITAPAAPTDGQAIAYVVTAQAYQTGTATPSAAKAAGDALISKDTNTSTVFVVLADGAGTGNGVSGVTDVTSDGKFTALAKDGSGNTVGFTVTSANVAIAKTSSVIKDGFSASNPKAIPGATITYTLTVTNNGSAPTTALALDDTLPLNVTFVGYDNGAGITCPATQVWVDVGCAAAIIIPGPPVHVTISGLNVTAAGGATPSHTIKYSVTIN